MSKTEEKSRETALDKLSKKVAKNGKVSTVTTGKTDMQKEKKAEKTPKAFAPKMPPEVKEAFDIVTNHKAERVSKGGAFTHNIKNMTEKHKEVAVAECYNGKHSSLVYPIGSCKVCPGYDPDKGSCLSSSRKKMLKTHTDQDNMGRKRRIRMLGRSYIAGLITDKQYNLIIDYETERHAKMAAKTNTKE